MVGLCLWLFAVTGTEDESCLGWNGHYSGLVRPDEGALEASKRDLCKLAIRLRWLLKPWVVQMALGGIKTGKSTVYQRQN
jgi:hypothetical protein